MQIPGPNARDHMPQYALERVCMLLPLWTIPSWIRGIWMFEDLVWMLQGTGPFVLEDIHNRLPSIIYFVDVFSHYRVCVMDWRVCYHLRIRLLKTPNPPMWWSLEVVIIGFKDEVMRGRTPVMGPVTQRSGRRPEQSLSPLVRLAENGHLPAGKKPFSETQLGQDFDLGLSTQYSWEISSCCGSALLCIFCIESEYTEPVSECVVQKKQTAQGLQTQFIHPHRDQGWRHLILWRSSFADVKCIFLYILSLYVQFLHITHSKLMNELQSWNC